MGDKCFFFAGGGTGGHIYPAMAVAEQIVKLEPAARVHFFCSTRSIDERILRQSGFEFTKLPAKGFSIRPGGLVGFCTSFIKSYRISKKILAGVDKAVVIGVGGFVAGPVCFAACKLKVPIVLLNVDFVPGQASRIIARWADEIFVQFEDTRKYFAKSKAKISVVGCPLRSSFENPQPNKAMEQLGLDRNKKTLLIIGGSSGAESINRAVCLLLGKLDAFAKDWQIVHLTGTANYEEINSRYTGTKIGHKVLGYFDNMPDLLAVADLVIGRSGAVSVAEYAAACVPSICMPYPYHKDRHQYLNAGKLVEAGAAIIVDDLPDEKDRAEWLWEELEQLLSDEEKRREMADACKTVAKLDAACKIAEKLLERVSMNSK